MSKKNFHVSPGSHGGWEIKITGGSGTFKTKDDAIKAAKEIAQRGVGGDIVIHGRDGKIVTKYSYGRDPNPPAESKTQSSKKGGTSITGPKKDSRNT